MNIIRILILEDDLETLSVLLDRLYNLEEKIAPIMVAVTILSEYTQVEDYINKTNKITFDVVLLDRDCKVGGSFHVLDIKKIGTERIIGISSKPPYNEQLIQKGIKTIINKDFLNLNVFANKVINELIKILNL